MKTDLNSTKKQQSRNNQQKKIMETTNDLKYTTEKFFQENGNRYLITVNIRLNDECGNGHEDFAITGDIRENGKEFMGGCIHEEITKHFPDLGEIFVPLLLADSNGADMYCVANGRFLLQKGKDDCAKSTLRVTDEELESLRPFRNDGDLFFSYQMEKMGLRARYKEEAFSAIATLEKLTGKKFESRATCQNWPKLTEEQAKDLEEKEASGFFTPEAAESRSQEKEEARFQKLITERKEDLAKTIRKEEDDFLVDMAILNVLRKTSYDAEVIFYNHTREITGNWHDGNHNSTKWNKETFAAFETEMRKQTLPENVTFILKK